jgi:hypothetical protein
VEVRSALNEHADVVAEFFGRVSTEVRTRWSLTFAIDDGSREGRWSSVLRSTLGKRKTLER